MWAAIFHSSKGLSTPEPVLQLGSYVFKGRYEGKFSAYIPHHKRKFSIVKLFTDTPGTCLFFRENGMKHNYVVMQLSFCFLGKELRYECASTKKLSMSRVVLKKKQTSSAANGELAEKDGT